MRYWSLYLFYFVYFIVNGFSTFVSKYYSEIGMTESMIGVLNSVPTLIALAFTPLLAILSDRVPKKRYLLAFIMLMMALASFAVYFCHSTIALLLAVSVYTIFGTNVIATSNAISLEYTRQIGKDFGPIRLVGTVGYQVGALLVGYLLSNSLGNLYPLMGAVLVASFCITFMMPNVEGHQHSRKKVPLTKLFADRNVRWLYIMIFFATISTQFYMAFFAVHLGDLGMSNQTVSWVTLLSVVAELPFLYFADRLAKKANVWNWVMFGILANGLRWLGLALSKSLVPILIIQIPAVTVMACFEYMPALYLNRKVSAELTGSAQSMLSLTSFGAARVVGSLLGGQICQYTGIPVMFAILGVMTLVGFVVFWPVSRKLIREETVLKLGD